MNLRDIALLLNAEIDGDPTLEISGVAKIGEARAGEISFIANPRYARHFGETRAGAVIVGKDFARPGEGGPALLRTADPYTAFLKILTLFHPPPDPVAAGIHPTAVIAPSAVLGADVRIGACVVVGDGVTIGDGSMIGAGSVLGDRVTIGPRSVLYARVVVRNDCTIGARVILQPGVVIGSDGFGFAPLPDGSYEKIPQVGTVVIEDDVEIGANTTVDRATLGETRIRRGTKLDNLIMVAHNVAIGEHTVIAAQTGISGSTTIGSHAMIGGQVGITGHLEIADRTRIGAQSGVHRSVPTPGTTLFGSPAAPQRDAFRIQGALSHLPDLLSTVRELKQKVEALEARLKTTATPAPDRPDRTGT